MAFLPRPWLALPAVLLLQASACASPAAPPAAPPALESPAPSPVLESSADGRGCTTDAQCPRGEVCVRCGVEESCTPGCHQDSQCPPGSRCRQVQCIRCPCPGQCD